MALGNGRQDRTSASRRPPDDSETNRAAEVLRYAWHRSPLFQFCCRLRSAVNVALHAMLSLLRLAPRLRLLTEQAHVTPAPPTQPKEHFNQPAVPRPGESAIRPVGTACLLGGWSTVRCKLPGSRLTRGVRPSQIVRGTHDARPC